MFSAALFQPPPHAAYEFCSTNTDVHCKRAEMGLDLNTNLGVQHLGVSLCCDWHGWYE